MLKSYKILSILFLIFLSFSTFAQKDHLVKIVTNFGEIHLILYDKTPLHKENFLKLAQEKKYDSTYFHRVIKNFMIQGGDINRRPGMQNTINYTIPAEIDSSLFHKKGVIAAARMPDQVNPEKASSGCQFYIVQGRKIPASMLNDKPENQVKAYTDLGGTPHLDQNYTVFGEVLQGIEVVDKIAKQSTNRADDPIERVYMQILIEEIPRKKIEKTYNYQYPN